MEVKYPADGYVNLQAGAYEALGESSRILLACRAVSKRRKEEQRWSERFQMERMVKRYELLQWCIPPLIWIASLWIPLQAVLPIAHELAGKSTALNVSFTFSVLVSIAASAAMLGMAFKYRGRKSEIQRLREIIEELEKEEKGAVMS